MGAETIFSVLEKQQSSPEPPLRKNGFDWLSEPKQVKESE
jgi:hypothetical protein